MSLLNEASSIENPKLSAKDHTLLTSQGPSYSKCSVTMFLKHERYLNLF